MTAVYVGDEAGWGKVAARLMRAADAGDPIGLDTEFYGVDVETQSCAARARVHVWSVAVLTKDLMPRGHRRAAGITLPADALEHEGLRLVLEDEEVLKAVHNLPVDSHALKSHGVDLRGACNTLSLARWVWPERAADKSGYGLKKVAWPLLRRKMMGDFRDVLSVPATPELRAAHPQQCWQRKEDKTWWYLVPLEEIVPGHSLWETLVPYAAEDAEAAVELWDAARKRASSRILEIPWTAD